jgi:hypothetical protein
MKLSRVVVGMFNFKCDEIYKSAFFSLYFNFFFFKILLEYFKVYFFKGKKEKIVRAKNKTEK